MDFKNIIYDETPNADTIEAIQEVQHLKEDKNKETYNSFEEILKELDDE